jgi:hypothetical protein
MTHMNPNRRMLRIHLTMVAWPLRILQGVGATMLVIGCGGSGGSGGSGAAGGSTASVTSGSGGSGGSGAAGGSTASVTSGSGGSGEGGAGGGSTPGGPLVTVDYSILGAAPTYRASGTTYGISEDGSLPQDHFFRDIKWHFMRAGGAQLDMPGGWVAGSYERRWNSVLAQYQRTVSFGGTFVILPHDLWGADGTSIPVYPGDDGDWTNFDNFVNQLISDVRANNMTVQWDLWNTPDLGTVFWGRSQAQYLEMWARFYRAVRAAFPDQLVVGPSTASQPNSSWWPTYLTYVRDNNVAPDIYSWHDEPGDPVVDASNADALLASYGLPHPRPYQVNQYAVPDMQSPGGGAWFIGRLERAGADGLRGNWGGGPALHDFLAGLLVKDSTGQYQPLGEWFMYRYYGSMSGNIVNSIPGPGVDGLATKDNAARNTKLLLGSSGTVGDISVQFIGLDTTTVVESGSVRAIVQRVPWNNGGPAAGPVTISDTTLAVTSNQASVAIPFHDAKDGYTVTLLPPSDTTFSSVAVAQHSHQCLDDTNLSLASGTQMQQYTCEGGSQQMWTFYPVAGVPDTYTAVNQLSGKCLDVADASTADGAAVQQSDCTGGTNQQFTFRKVIYSGSGPQDYQLVAQHSGRCVDVNGESTTPGARIIQWPCNPVTRDRPLNQTWRLLGR